MHSRPRALAPPPVITLVVVLSSMTAGPSAAQPAPPPLADLTIVEVSVAPTTGPLRTARVLQFTQVNLGPGASPPTITCLNVVPVDSNRLTITQPIAVPALSPGDQHVDTWTFTLDAPGDFQATVIADCEATVVEPSETNNFGSARVSATPGPLELLTTELPPATVGQLYATTLVASGDAPPLTYSGSVPPGLTLSTDGTITGVPTVSGTFPVIVQVVDALGATVTGQLRLQVLDDRALTIVSTELPPATLGQRYCGPEATLQAVGGSPPYTWIPLGTLPDGLTLSTSGALCGVPTTVGRASFDVEVRDRDTVARGQVSLDVRPEPLEVDTTPLSARAGELSSARVRVRGGVPPYTFLEAEGLPAGLALDRDGALVGVPTTAGQATLSVAVIDATGERARGAVPLAIAPRASTSTPELELADPAGCACGTSGPADLGFATLWVALVLARRARRPPRGARTTREPLTPQRS